MRNQRITDEQAAALLSGRVPQGREDLQQVAAVVGTLRLVAFEALPRPSAALAARLDLDRLAWVSATRGAAAPDCDAERTTVLTRHPAKGKAKTALGWFTGLGVAAQLALGAGAVSASAAGIGMAGALPPAAQDVFDAVVETVARADELLTFGSGEGDADSTVGEVGDDARTGADRTGPVDPPPGIGLPDEADPAKESDLADDGDPAAEESDAATAPAESDDSGQGDHAGAHGNAQGKPEKLEKPAKSVDSTLQETLDGSAGKSDQVPGNGADAPGGKGKEKDTGNGDKKGGAAADVDDAVPGAGVVDDVKDKIGKESGGQKP